jgi:hypothetical protein
MKRRKEAEGIRSTHWLGVQHRRKYLGVECGDKAHLMRSACSSPAPPKQYTADVKTYTSRAGYKHYCSKCFKGHVCGVDRHSRKSVKRPRAAASNRARAVGAGKPGKSATLR